MLHMCTQSFSLVRRYDPMDLSPPGSSVCGILKVRILEWVAISFSRGSSQPRNQTQISCIAGRDLLLTETVLLYPFDKLGNGG